MEKFNGLKIPLIIDSALLLVIVFQSGVAWSQIRQLADDVAALRNQLQVAQSVQPANIERLARIEEGVVYLRQDMANLRAEIHNKDTRR